MVIETELLFLKAIRYSDSRQIIKGFSRDYGQLSALLSMSGKARSGSLLFPCSCIHLLALKKSSSDLLVVREMNTSMPLPSITTDPRKSLVAYFIAELLLKTTTPDFPLPYLYDGSKTLLRELDSKKEGLVHFPARFMHQLSHHLGVEPDSSILSKELLQYHHMLQNNPLDSASDLRHIYIEAMIRHLQGTFHFKDLQAYAVLKSIYS